MPETHSLPDTGSRTPWTPERIAATSRAAVVVVLGGIAGGIFAVAANLYWVGAIVAATLACRAGRLAV